MHTLREILGIELPIIQAPMAGVQLSALAIAVSNAGGLGSLPCAMLGTEALEQELERMRSGTDQPFNVNFFCHTPPPADTAREAEWVAALQPYFEELALPLPNGESGPARTPFSEAAADILEKKPPAVVSFHFGLPSPELVVRVRSWGSKIFGCATTVDEARWLAQRGADAIIAQGLEAGGHRGNFLSDDLDTQVGIFALLPQMIHAVNVPVIAAGGIADATGVAAAMSFGAAGVQIGTAFLLCPEATTSAVHRGMLTSEHASNTALTNLFTGRPARGIVNRLMRELGPMHQRTPAFPNAAAAVGPLRAGAEARGSGDFSPLWAGQNVSGCKAVPAAALLRELAALV